MLKRKITPNKEYAKSLEMWNKTESDSLLQNNNKIQM